AVPAGSLLSALFIDYDNVYLALRNRNEEAASRFARNPMSWFSQLLNGRLIKSADGQQILRRRIAVARCYGNPAPWRHGRNGPEDPNCFAFVRHNFLRAGMEVVDCPKLTSQFKNSSDIRMACDIRDYLSHPVRFDEFIILSGDSDFTPVLMNLRSFDRRRAIYTNEYTSPYYRAFCDGWVEEADLINYLGQAPQISAAEQSAQLGHDSAAHEFLPLQSPKVALPHVSSPDASAKRRGFNGDGAVQSLIADFKVISQEITQLVVEIVENSLKPVPLAYLADRAQKALGQPKTVGTNWAGCGGFLNFLQQNLPSTLSISEKPPQVVYNPARHNMREEAVSAPVVRDMHVHTPTAPKTPAPQSNSSKIADLQRSITRIYDACQAPPLPPSEYQLLFTLIAAEVRERSFRPDTTAQAVVVRAQDAGLKLAVKDVAFVLDAVDEIDPWLERTQSPAAVARAYRDYVLARCSGAGLHLSDDEHQLIQVWFGASQWGPQTATDTDRSTPVQYPKVQQQQRLGQSNAGDAEKPDATFLRNGASNYQRGAPQHPNAGQEIPFPPDFGFGAENEMESPLETGRFPSLRFNFSKRN
ncbi:MAG: NYN domain-containing protein, partial [Hyphomicrobiales bacterium]|nr:NYN domain-containing protein [Hyphomicrobiales bacterium]